MSGACDSLMESMKEVCPSLQGVYERSDAMLAVYPGEGARFAKHIDNSTGTSFRCVILHDFYCALCIVYLVLRSFHSSCARG